MSTDDTIFSFLTKPENLRFALEVADYVGQLKRDMHKSFWTLYNTRMDERVKSSQYSRNWRYEGHPAARYRKTWGKSYISPASDAEAGVPQLQLVFGQSTPDANYRLFWGVRWTTPPAEEFSHQALATLATLLVNQGMTTVELPRYVRWGYTDYVPYSEGFLRRMYDDHDAFVNGIVDDVWSRFGELRPLMEAVNAARQKLERDQ